LEGIAIFPPAYKLDILSAEHCNCPCLNF
jgi:hypothetical protein